MPTFFAFASTTCRHAITLRSVAPPQEFAKARDIEKASAKTWVQERDEVETTGGGDLPGGIGSKDDTGAKEKKASGWKKQLPKKVDLGSVKAFLPAGVVGCRVWFEWQSNRIRVQYTTSAGNTSTSWELSRHTQEEACREAIRWAWKRHLECHVGADCPYNLGD